MRKLLILLAALFPVGAIAAGESPSTYDRVTLSVNVEDQVANDTILAQLYSEREGEKASQAASEVNRNIAWAIELGKAVEQVSVQTAGYYSQPVYRDRRVIGWRVRQSIELESRDAGSLSELIGALQERLAMSSISYNISPNLRAETENALVKQALAAFGKRAQMISNELGRPGYRIVNLDVITSDTPTRPVASRLAMNMAAEAAVAPPAIEGGTQLVRVGVNGIIELELD